MASLLSSEKNISYFTILPAYALALSGSIYSRRSGPGKKHYDTQNPRHYIENLKKSQGDEKVRARLLRAEYASANSFEALPLFLAAVTAANAAGVSPLIMNMLSISWLASRVLYMYVYIWYQEREKLAPGQTALRGKVWFVGTGIWLSMFILAGLKA